MKSIAHLFADIIAGLEDLHAVAVEGQARHAPPELQEALARALQAGMERLRRKASKIARRVGAEP